MRAHDPPDEELEGWIERQFRFSAGALLRSISATGLVKERPGFHQRVVPKPGSVLASPELASYDPDPDYFFHWFRDGALVIEALRVLIEDRAVGSIALQRFGEFLTFNRDLQSATGSAWLDGSLARPGATNEYRQFLRPEAKLEAVSGDEVMADTRVNPDGTIDVIRWGRPQTDGSPLRALTLLRFWHMEAVSAMRPAMRELIEADLSFTARRWPEPSIDLWEEESGHHYYTRRVQAAALAQGAAWKSGLGDPRQSDVYAAAAAAIGTALDGHWSEDAGCYLSRADPGVTSRHALDIATILAVVHAQAASGPHSVVDPKTQATLVQIEDLFDREFPINRGRSPAHAPALGRYAGDVYYGGGAFYLGTLAAAEFYFRLADAVTRPGGRTAAADPGFLRRVIESDRAERDGRAPAAGSDLAAALTRRGDMFLATVRAYTPVSGELSEQFDRNTGGQTSAKNLTWSYAAFVTAAAARKRARRRMDTVAGQT